MPQSVGTQVIILAAHKLHRATWDALLAQQPGIEVWGTAANQDDLSALPLPVEPSVVLVDFPSPSTEIISDIAQIRPNCSLLVMVNHYDLAETVALLQAGTTGSLSRDATVADLARAVIAASRREIVLPPSLAAKALAALARGEVTQKQSDIDALTGDSNDVAKAVSEELGIDRYFAEVLPEDKDKKVMELQAQGKKAAMVGDGVNDAPALIRANIGIAIGSGTDVAVESAGLILVQSNPLDVVKIIKLSKASRRKMVQNIWWAAGYNIIAIPLAAGILAPVGFDMPPAIGALVMSISTIIVALNAQTLRRLSFR